MNTYQITGICRTGDSEKHQMAAKRIDAETLEEARSRFLAAHPAPWWTITGEELVGINTPEETRSAEEQPNPLEELEPAEPRRKLLDATERLQELGRLVSSLKEELEEQRYQRAEAERKRAEAQHQLAKVQEEAEEQSIRAERAEDEVIRLKAKLYDYIMELE